MSETPSNSLHGCNVGKTLPEESQSISPVTGSSHRAIKLKVLIGGKPLSEHGSSKTVKSYSLANVDESKHSPKKLEFPKFSLTLTQQEIEQDIFALTGSKPPRKFTKRPKSVQRQLDELFPGGMLESITPDDYKVPEASKKKKK